MNNVLRNTALALALATAAASSYALKLSHVRPGNFTAGAGFTLVPLNAAGQTTIFFNLGGASKKVLTYSAECSVDAPAGNNFAWTDIDIIVNGVVVPPTAGSSDAFCSADGVAGFGGYVRASITVLINGVAGANSVNIRTTGQGGATGVWLGDSSLVISD
jgi:hypothetical protein